MNVDTHRAAIEQILRMRAKESPGACGLYIDAAGNSHSAALGFADLNWRIGFDPDVRVNCGSVAKVIHAEVVKQQCGEGKFSIDDSIGDLILGIPDSIGSLRVLDLIDCRTNLRDYNSFIRLIGCPPETSLSGAHLMDIALTQCDEEDAIRMQDQFWYSSTNWMILGATMQYLNRAPIEQLFDSVTGGVGQLARTRSMLTIERCAQGYNTDASHPTGWRPHLLFADGIGASNFYASPAEISHLIRRLCPDTVLEYGYHQGWLHLPAISIAAGADAGFCTCVIVVRETREVICITANAGTYPTAKSALMLTHALADISKHSHKPELPPRTPLLGPGAPPEDAAEFRNEKYGIHLTADPATAELTRRNAPPITLRWCESTGLYKTGLVRAAMHNGYALISHDGCYPIRMTAV
ncbi:hypothetical protein ACIA8C_23005 [Nocardia sp. NPDC051321]|uniref:hypothetical protein n=1 Tax=Nocardia sp. NPDC051321 TaxID=3364323 RepID=UPI0037AB44E8